MIIWKAVATPRSCLELLIAKFNVSTVRVVTLPAPIKYTGVYKDNEIIIPIPNEVNNEEVIKGILMRNNLSNLFFPRLAPIDIKSLFTPLNAGPNNIKQYGITYKIYIAINAIK